MAEPPSGYSLVLQCMCMAVLGLLVSHFISQYGRNSEEVRGTCEDFIKWSKLPKGMRLGSKTPYQFKVAINSDDSQLGGCKAVQLYAVFRHGTRFPSEKYVLKWNEFQSVVKEKLCSLSPAANRLKNWVNPFSVDSGEVTERGMWEQYCLGKRFLKRYCQLLNRNYTDEAFSFRTTQKARTVRSALSFAEGLFEGDGPLNGYEPIFLESESLESDHLLRFFDEPCPLYDQQVRNNESLSEMIGSYLESSEVKTVVEHVQHQLDPEQGLWNVTSDDVMTMYKICIHEMGVLKHSEWCSLFSGEDMAVLEYFLDLKTYWKRGYGFDVNWRRSLPLVESIVDFFHSYTTNFSNPRLQKVAMLRFAHAETIVPLLCFLGLFKDPKPLLPTNYEEMKNRQFSMRNIAPFSGNVAFVLYDCNDGSTQQKDRLHVRVLVNEVPVPLPGCSSRPKKMCPLSELLKKVELTAQGQNVSEFCTVL